MLNGAGTTTFFSLSIEGIVTSSGSIIIDDIMYIGVSGQLNANTSSITFSGNGGPSPFIVDGAFTASSSLLTYSGSLATTIATGTYYNLTVDTDYIGTLGGNVTVTNVLTINAGKTLNVDTYSLTLSGTGTPLVHAGATFNNGSGTVSYTGATANVASTTYSNLTLGTGTYTMLAATTVTGTLTNTGTLSATSTLTLSGSGTPFVNSGTFTANSSTVSYTNTGSVTTTGASYWTLTLGSGTYNFGGNTTSTNSFTNGGILTIGSSYYLYAPNTFDNNGTTTESGIIKHPLTSSKLTDSSGTEVTTFGASDSVYVSVTDSDGNLDASTVNTMTGSVVTASTYSDSETITLTETGVDTGVFRSAALPFDLSAEAFNNNATFEVAGNGSLALAFTDSKDSSDTGSDTASFLNSNLSSGGSSSGPSSSSNTPSPIAPVTIPVVTPAPALPPVVTPSPVVDNDKIVSPQPTPTIRFDASTRQFTKDLTTKAIGNDVRALQETLKSLGYFKHPSITGYYGAVTAKAVSDYQKANGLTVNGKLDSATRSVLNGGTATPVAVEKPVVTQSYKFVRNLYVGSSGTDVRSLQQLLKDLGYYTHPTITGYYGLVTKEAVVKFQKDKDLKPYPGWVGPGTRTVLNSL